MQRLPDRTDRSVCADASLSLSSGRRWLSPCGRVAGAGAAGEKPRALRPRFPRRGARSSGAVAGRTGRGRPSSGRLMVDGRGRWMVQLAEDGTRDGWDI